MINSSRRWMFTQLPCHCDTLIWHRYFVIVFIIILIQNRLQMCRYFITFGYGIWFKSASLIIYSFNCEQKQMLIDRILLNYWLIKAHLCPWTFQEYFLHQFDFRSICANLRPSALGPKCFYLAGFKPQMTLSAIDLVIRKYLEDKIKIFQTLLAGIRERINTKD